MSMTALIDDILKKLQRRFVARRLIYRALQVSGFHAGLPHMGLLLHHALQYFAGPDRIIWQPRLQKLDAQALEFARTVQKWRSLLKPDARIQEKQASQMPAIRMLTLPRQLVVPNTQPDFNSAMQDYGHVFEEWENSKGTYKVVLRTVLNVCLALTLIYATYNGAEDDEIEMYTRIFNEINGPTIQEQDDNVLVQHLQELTTVWRGLAEQLGLFTTSRPWFRDAKSPSKRGSRRLLPGFARLKHASGDTWRVCETGRRTGRRLTEKLSTDGLDYFQNLHKPSGLHWTRHGNDKPIYTQELTNTPLSVALGNTDNGHFSQEQWNGFGVQELSMNHAILASNNNWYRPASKASADGHYFVPAEYRPQADAGYLHEQLHEGDYIETPKVCYEVTRAHRKVRNYTLTPASKAPLVATSLERLRPLCEEADAQADAQAYPHQRSMPQTPMLKTYVGQTRYSMNINNKEMIGMTAQDAKNKVTSFMHGQYIVDDTKLVLQTSTQAFKLTDPLSDNDIRDTVEAQLASNAFKFSMSRDGPTIQPTIQFRILRVLYDYENLLTPLPIDLDFPVIRAAVVTAVDLVVTTDLDEEEGIGYSIRSDLDASQQTIINKTSNQASGQPGVREQTHKNLALRAVEAGTAAAASATVGSSASALPIELAPIQPIAVLGPRNPTHMTRVQLLAELAENGVHCYAARDELIAKLIHARENT